uniref:Uncharacterized protein n=1 Tax=Oryza brachyantha TaxID=4533 RepID=J3MFR4_ORYBR
MSLLVSHCSQGRTTPSDSTGEETFGSAIGVSSLVLSTTSRLLKLVSLLSPSKEEKSVSSTFDRKSSKYCSASSV